jgi:hypothetical protein
MRIKTGISTLLLLLILPTLARATSYTYSFNSDVANFSFKQPSLTTTSQILSIHPFKLDGVLFTYADVLVSGGFTCFQFGTEGISGDCENWNSPFPSPFSEMQMTFADVTGAGTYMWYTYQCSAFGSGSKCIFPLASNGGWNLTISPSATPEPSSIMLFGSGLFALAGTMCRKRRH